MFLSGHCGANPTSARDDDVTRLKSARRIRLAADRRGFQLIPRSDSLAYIPHGQNGNIGCRFARDGPLRGAPGKNISNFRKFHPHPHRRPKHTKAMKARITHLR